MGNEKRRAGGFSPDPLVTGSQPRQGASEQDDDELVSQLGSLGETRGSYDDLCGKDGIGAPGEESVQAV